MPRVVIDTHVFLQSVLSNIIEGSDEMIESCDKIIINTKIVNEYKGRAHSHDYRAIDIIIALQKLDERDKIVRKGKTACENVVVPNREIQHDAHLIKAAKAGRAQFIITRERMHLLDYKLKIDREFHINVVTPEEYLQITE